MPQKFKKEDIEQDKLFQQYIRRGIKKSPNTIEHIQLRLCRYCNFIEKTPKEFIDDALDEQKNPDIREYERQIEEQLLKFRETIENSGNTKNTVKATMSTIKSFYRGFNVEVPSVQNFHNPRPSDEQNTTDDLPNIEQLEMAINFTNPKYKAIISLGMSSGMGSAELRSLTIQDFIDAHGVSSLEDIDLNHVPEWNIKRVKADNPHNKNSPYYYTFSTPESNKYIMHYLEGRKAKVQEKHRKALRKYKGKATVILPDNIQASEYLFEGKKGHRIREMTLVINYGRINNKLGLPSPKTDPNRNCGFLRSHTVRKFFRSTIGNAGMPEDFAEWLIGHKKQGISDTYFKRNKNVAREEYEKVMDELSIEKVKLRELDTKEKAKMQERIDELEKFKATVEEIFGKTPEEAFLKIMDAGKDISNLPKPFSRKNKR